ncbi:hypothetical protein [Sphingomonas sp. Leaf28]|uniref:hypothetical protein n=1 Tax=Sphingomonas sp. Leaf28 TaxID=1735695 RepID=UPI0006FC96AE|nr:hypothetical protein [Sphingomonas sp. Leaf28]KQN09062.1 hypothetical protein ASE79_14515 [Sphingomonas sp. Leaf28]
MSDGNKAEAATSSSGTPVTTSTTLTATTVVPVPNPLLEPKNLMEAGGVILMIAGVFALIEKRADKRRKEDHDLHKLSHDAVNKEIGDLKHDIKNNETAINVVANNRTSDVERIVKLEIGQQNIEKGQVRIEHTMEKNHKETLDQMKAWADQFAESIREVRNVGPKGS